MEPEGCQRPDWAIRTRMQQHKSRAASLLKHVTIFRYVPLSFFNFYPTATRLTIRAIVDRLHVSEPQLKHFSKRLLLRRDTLGYLQRVNFLVP